MSIEHLKQLRNALKKNNWVVFEELPGDNYRISGYWKISRPDSSSKLTIAFDGLDDMVTLPIEKAYAFKIVEAPEISAYFGKISKSWPKELETFISHLNTLKT